MNRRYRSHSSSTAPIMVGKLSDGGRASRAGGTSTFRCAYSSRALFIALLFLIFFVNLMLSGSLHRRAAANMETLCSNSLQEISALAGPNLRYDSSDATVMSYAMGYNLEVYQRFVGSLRNSGFTGTIILVVSNVMQEGVEDYLSEKNVTIAPAQVINCTYDLGAVAKGDGSHQREAKTCLHPYPDLKARWSRFPILRDLLVQCKQCTGPVLVSDFRDTFFQRDPFGDGAPEIQGLEVFEEFKAHKTDMWIVNGPVFNCKNISFDEQMLCSGTTIGTRKAMIEYLSIMEKEMHEWMKDPKCCCNLVNGDDQSIHNYLFYTKQLPFAIAIPNRMGTVHTVGAQASWIFSAHKKHIVDLLKVNQYEAAGIPYQGADDKYKWLGDHFDLTDEEVSSDVLISPTSSLAS